MEFQTMIAQLEGELAPQLEEISHFLFAHPELGLEEHQAAQYLSDWMEQ